MLASQLRTTLPVLLGLCLLYGSLPPAHAQQPSQPQTSCASTGNASPGGLVVVIIDKPQSRSLDLRALSNPCISGVALQIHWAELEPVQGQPEWSKLDQLFAAAKSSHKWVQLLIFPGFFSPAWALQGGVKTQTFPVEYGPGKGTMMPLPMPWDRIYLERWLAFLRLLGERYGRETAFRVMAAAGPTSVSVEMSLPQGPMNMKTWQSEGYTSRKYMEAWNSVLQACATDFPNQWVSLALGIGLNLNNQGKIDHGEGGRTREMIIDRAMALLKSRFVLQNSDLSAGPVRHPATQLVIGYSGRVITGLQMRTSAQRESADMGAASDPPLALRRSIDLGMEPNGAGRRVNYLEIYEPDVMADDMQPALRYGASLFGSIPHAAPKELPK